MTKKYIFLDILRNEEITKNEIQIFAAEMERAVNAFGFLKSDICEMILDNPISTKNFLKISLTWIQNLAKRAEWQYDGRNEASVRKARELVNGMSSENQIMLQEYADIMSSCFVKEAMQWHRTLQQTFSGLVFCFFDKVEIPKNLDEISINIGKMKEKYGENWYGLPLV